PGLLGRWGLNEGSGTVAGDSSGHAVTGTIAGTNWRWVAGAPFTDPANAAPTAVNDSATTAEDTSTTIAALANDTGADADARTVTGVRWPSHGPATLNPIGTPVVLTNDPDVDGDSLAAVLVSGPANGTLPLNPDGSFTYTPAANFNGTDTFTYKANDGTADSTVATVTITVAAVNDAPVSA